MNFANYFRHSDHNAEVHTPAAKQKYREQLAEHVSEFLKNGGKIDQRDPSERRLTDEYLHENTAFLTSALPPGVGYSKKRGLFIVKDGQKIIGYEKDLSLATQMAEAAQQKKAQKKCSRKNSPTSLQK